ncbi:MAG: hypothetical protein WD081_03450 [Gammaproteobacteria bacterium]
MNTKLNMLILLVALTFALPANAEDVNEQIRDQGRAALASIGAEIKQSLNVPPQVDPAAVYPVDEAIRIQGRQAVRRITIGLVLARYRQAGPAVATTE